MSDVTYGQLDQVLRSLGFSRRRSLSEPINWIYEHESGALVLLPVFPDSDIVLARHLVAVRGTLTQFGIASLEDFSTRLQPTG